METLLQGSILQMHRAGQVYFWQNHVDGEAYIEN
jgi:hypothetical protein